MSKDTGGPAFPSHHDDEFGYSAKGMTLRDYFAAKAIQGIIADPHYSDLARTMGYAEFGQEAVEDAYAVADAMLKERSK